MLLPRKTVFHLSRSYVPSELRRRVASLANDRCEYCLIPILYGFITPYEMDHIVSEKHGGETTLENLALACKICNSLKGSDLSTYLPEKRWLSDFTIREKTGGKITTNYKTVY